MPTVDRIDNATELRKLASLMRKGIYASSRYDADYIMEPAAAEIDRLRNRADELDRLLTTERWVALEELAHHDPEAYARLTGAATEG